MRCGCCARRRCRGFTSRARRIDELAPAADQRYRGWIVGKTGRAMPFIASNGLTEAATSKTVAAGGMNVHYHDLGQGEPVLFLHSYGPGTTAWITFHKAIGPLSQHFRCILMDLPNFSKTGPIVYHEG